MHRLDGENEFDDGWFHLYEKTVFVEGVSNLRSVYTTFHRKGE